VEGLGFDEWLCGGVIGVVDLEQGRPLSQGQFDGEGERHGVEAVDDCAAGQCRRDHSIHMV
jgi:hypothetical protein